MRVVAIPAPLATEPSTTVIVGSNCPRPLQHVPAESSLRSSRSIRKEKRAPARSSRPTSPAQKGRLAVDPYRLAYRPAARRVSASRGCGRRRHGGRQRVPRRVRTDVCGGARSGRPLPWCSELDGRYVSGPSPRCAHAGPRWLQTSSLQALRSQGQLPIKASSRVAANPLTIAATLVHPDQTTVLLDRTQGTSRDYATGAGKVYRVPLPTALSAGSYRLIVESTLGRTVVTRELQFSVLPQR